MDNPEIIREKILKLTRDYHAAAHKKDPNDFQPGETRVPYAGRCYDEREMVSLVDSALEFWLTYGTHSKRFEKDLATFLGVDHAAMVNSGSSANLLAFMSLTSPSLGDRAVRPGDEIITVAAAFPTTVAPMVQYGAVPVFVDVNVETLNLDPRSLATALSAKTKAVFIAHTLGNPFAVDAVKSFCSDNDLWLIEDNCDSLGAKYNGQYTGSFGDLGTSSFYPPHHITMGEGGAVYTSDPRLKRIMLSMRDWGRDCWCDSGVDNTCGKRFSQQFGTLPFGYDHKFVYSHFGYNLKATDMQAAIGVEQLRKLPGFIQRRQENYQCLKEGLADLEDTFIFTRAEAASEPSWFGFLMTLRDEVGISRNDVATQLEEAKIQTRNLFGGNLVRHPCFDSLNEGKHYRVAEPLTNTDKIMNDSFWVGVYPGMTSAALDYIIERIRGAVGK